MAPFDYESATALITGASRGIGAALARELASRAIARLVLVARSESELQLLAQRLEDVYGTDVHVIVADLTDPEMPAAIKEETDRRGLEIDLLVNNAGFGSHGFFEELNLERELSMISLNVSALTALTRLYLPGMQERGWGGVLNVASTASFVPVPFMATYAATKAFVLSFSEALWSEARERGGDVRICCLCPGGTQTGFGEAVGSPRGKFEESQQASPHEVAEVGLNALDRGASYVVAGAANWAGVLGTRLAPRAMVADYVGTIFRPDDAPTPSVIEAATRRRMGAASLAAGAAALVIGVLASRNRRG